MKPGVFLGRVVDAWMRTGARSVRSGEARGVLLVTSGGLGDTVLLALVLPRLIELAEDGEPVTILMRRNGAKMAFLFPKTITVEAVDYGRFARSPAYRLKISQKLFNANYRLVVSTDYLRHPDLDDAMIRAAHAGESLAMEPRSWPKYDAVLRNNREIYARLFDSGPPLRDKVLRWVAFADWLTGTSALPPKVRLADDHLPPPAALGAPTVLIQPFSAVAAKQSPVSLYEKILAVLPEGTDVRLLGTPGDLDRNPAYRALLENPNVIFDSSTFEELVPVLRAARLVISVDTALMHLAVALGAPTICLASAAYVGEIVPYATETKPDNVDFLYHDMDCRSCLGACIHAAENGMYPCVARADHTMVLKQVQAHFAARGDDQP